MIKFVANSPALFIKKEKMLVIADLHIGLEYELAKKGIVVPSQTKKMEKRLYELLNITRAKHVVILGDIKHEYAGVSWSELTDVPAFFDAILKKAKVSVVKGNHDGGIESILPNSVNVYEPSGFVISDFLLTHGQAWPKKSSLYAKFLILGHIHPAIEFWSAGARCVEHVWLRAPINKRALESKFKVKSNLEKAIIVPVFNHLAGGFALNASDFKPTGPLLSKAIKWKEGEIFLLDGTFLGKLNSLLKD